MEISGVPAENRKNRSQPTDFISNEQNTLYENLSGKPLLNQRVIPSAGTPALEAICTATEQKIIPLGR